MKLGLISLGLCAASALLAGFAVVVAAIAAGPTVAGGERALIAAAIFDLLILLAALAAFWWASRDLRLLWRALSITGFAAVEVLILGFALVVIVVILNR
jgi:hypothetical protein